ncbi:uncharacterized protein LOC131221060 [Magnolia sinica]|uniref:uncharacterized protein LOC131221060 n=1 Tax=Magnolia sinica TaxID=86752 RepID=UPI00265A8A00|nr:uncharacterized protein LOC131221060 [Magnolia sinica]
MAMSDPSSNPADWVQFYQGQGQGSGRQMAHPHSSAMFGRAPMVAEAIVTTTTTATTASSISSGTMNSATTHLNNETRGGRPARRRSRASRRAPVTLLNTDTTNFRAMVQQFTGVPTAPFQSTVHPSGPNFEFGSHDRRLGTMGPPARPYYHHHLYSHQHQQQQHQQQQQQHQLRQEESMFSVGHGTDVYHPGFGNPRPHLEISQGFLESLSSHVMPRQSSTENDTSGFIL